MMHFALLFPVFVVLVCLPETSTFMDCRPSCQKCRKGSSKSDVLELYCSICKECRDRNHNGKVETTRGEHKEGTKGGGISSTGHPRQHTKRLVNSGGRLVAAGGRPGLAMGPRGRLLGPRGRLLRPRLDFLKKHPFDKGGRLGKMGNGALRFMKGPNGTLNIADHRTQILSKYAPHPVHPHSETTTLMALPTTTVRSIEKLVVKMKQIEKDLHKERNKNHILRELRNELQSNEGQLMQPNQMHPLQSNEIHPLQSNEMHPLQPHEMHPLQPNEMHPLQPHEMHPLQPNEMHPLQPKEMHPLQPNPMHHLQPNQMHSLQPNQMNPLLMEYIQKHLNTQKNIHPLLRTDQNELQSNEVQPMQSNEQHRMQQDYVVKSLSGQENVPTFLPLDKLRPLFIGDQIVYLHEATTARPADCPPPPPGCEEVTEKVLLLAVTTTSTTTTSTTTTTKPLEQSPCPPIICEKTESCCPDCPCPEAPPPPPPMLPPPPPPMLPPPPPPMLPPPPPPMLPPPPPPMLPPPPPPMLPLPPPMLLPPPPPMLPQPPPLMLRPRPLMLPPPPPMIPRAPLPMLPPPPPPMLPRPPLPMLPPLRPPPPPPPIMAIPMMPQLLMPPPMSMPKPRCMGGGCNYPHGIRPSGHDDQDGQTLHGVHSYPNVLGENYTPFDFNIYPEYNGKIRYTDYLRKEEWRKSTVRQHSDKDYYYLYVGVPKNNVDHLKNNLLREGVHSNTIHSK